MYSPQTRSKITFGEAWKSILLANSFRRWGHTGKGTLRILRPGQCGGLNSVAARDAFCIMLEQASGEVKVEVRVGGVCDWPVLPPQASGSIRMGETVSLYPLT